MRAASDSSDEQCCDVMNDCPDWRARMMAGAEYVYMLQTNRCPTPTPTGGMTIATTGVMIQGQVTKVQVQGQVTKVKLPRSGYQG